MKTMQGKRSAPKAARGIGGGGGMWTRPSNPPAAPVRRPPPVDKQVLQVGDLVMFREQRTVYRVAKRKKAGSFDPDCQYYYDIRVVLDPMSFSDDEPLEDGTDVPVINLRKVGLVELGNMRLKIDNFIKEEVKRLQGQDA